MTEAEAQEIAQLQWGPRGFAYVLRRFTGTEKPGPDGWVSPEGEVYGYSVGYHRTGKRGARLTTEKGRSDHSFEEALARAEAAMTPQQRAAYEKRTSKNQ